MSTIARFRHAFSSCLLCLGATTAGAQDRFVFTEIHMGMAVRITGYAPNESSARVAAQAAFAEIARLEDIFSDYRPSAEVRRLSGQARGWIPVSEELFIVLDKALLVARFSHGAFDPTVGPMVALWRESRRTGRLPHPDSLATARGRTGWAKVALDTANRAVQLAQPGMRLDLGGIAKGFILQRARDVLRRHGVDASLIQAGGDLVVGAAPPGRAGWRVDLATEDTALRRAARALINAAVATSGPAAQSISAGRRRYSHVIDPHTGLGLASDRMATVIGSDAALADAAATAATVLGLVRGQVFLQRLIGVQGRVERIRGAKKQNGP
ncbi:MAG: FAD:protein FMN transferase [Gemmatimonadaceae bacterium]